VKLPRRLKLIAYGVLGAYTVIVAAAAFSVGHFA